MKKYLENCSTNLLPVLVLGDTGTGKSHLAKEIHKKSKNSNGQFIQLNIASLSENLFESELFGHVKGAFSGATIDKKGFCEHVGSGTLFLDEIGEMSLQAQSKLLTLLDERIFYSVGSVRKKMFYGRVIVATNKNLDEMVAKGSFREDLYYRLRLNKAVLPKLQDKLNLKEIILEEIQNSKVRNENYTTRIEQKALEVLFNYKWPGNYREMKNTIEYILNLPKQLIMAGDLPDWLNDKSLMVDSKNGGYHDAMCSFEQSYLKSNLEKYEGRINHTAEMIGLNKVTLISKLKKYGIDRREYKHLNNTKKAYGF